MKTTYLGLQLKNPIIVGANKLTGDITTLKQLESAGAVVLKSLFEEQIQLEMLEHHEAYEQYEELHAEMLSLTPRKIHAGPEEYLRLCKEAKATLTIPVIASLNAVYLKTWSEYAHLIAQTGVDALELNFYDVPLFFEDSSQDIEDKIVTIVESLSTLTIPLAVKLPPFLTNPLHLVKRLDTLGTGFVLFNRLFQPDIDIVAQQFTTPFNLSTSADNKVAIRMAGLLHNRIRGSICLNTGIHTGEDVIKMLLAGADCVQIVSTLYKNGTQHIEHMLQFIQHWMKQHNYTHIEEFRGKLSYTSLKDPFVYKRAQYIDILMQCDAGELMKRYGR